MPLRLEVILPNRMKNNDAYFQFPSCQRVGDVLDIFERVQRKVPAKLLLVGKDRIFQKSVAKSRL